MYVNEKRSNKCLTVFLFLASLETMKTEYDERLIRCPKLGDKITFPYCLKESGELPCARIVRCWSHIFDVESLLKKTLGQEKWNHFVKTKPSDKMTSLLELIEAAKVKK